MKVLFIIAACFTLLSVTAGEVDTLRRVEAENVVVRNSTKETNKPWSTPSAISVISPFKINQRGIDNIKGLSGIVPNFFIPDYGSKMTTPVYLRGIGARSSGQSIGMYVDNIPYMDKSTFDFELMDIQRIEVLRGPQGTLYGRNAMGGIINIYTLSPFDYQGTKISVSAGNYGYIAGKVSTYQKFSEKVAFSAGLYYDQKGGYFKNEATQERQDNGWNIGGRLKLDWKITDRLTASIASSYDYTDQNAFPYGFYDANKDEIRKVNYNDRGTYLRNMSNNSLRLEYRTDKILLTSNTGYQWLRDDMWMDQDFTKNSIFTINQRQLQNSINQEIVVKSVDNRNYQWSVGAFGFYNALKTNSLVTFKQDGIKTILQPVFDKMMPPSVPISLLIKDNEIYNPGHFSTPTWGAAIFHQSTFNNLLTEGLSATIGIRLDYEKQYLNYNTDMGMSVEAVNKYTHQSMGVMAISKMLDGGQQQSFLRALPKVSIKYECTPNIMTYATVSRGYKAGGYNIQMFSEIIQDSLRNSRPPMPGGGGGGRPQSTARASQPETGQTTEVTLKDVISYKPESVWNYEIGSRGEFGEGVFEYDFALFYMDVKDLQLTQFVNGGSGRILTNAGHSTSYGVEVALNSSPIENLHLDASYGYTHSTFDDYNDGMVDYTGKFVPYVPQHTFTVGANYTFVFNSWLEALTLGVNYNGIGKMYWTEANDIAQNYYGLLNARVGLRAGIAKLEFWANNILNQQYGAFYFESFGNSFIQKGRPFTFGATLSFTI